MSEPTEVSTHEALDALILLHESGDSPKSGECPVAVAAARESAESTLSAWRVQLATSEDALSVASDCDAPQS